MNQFALLFYIGCIGSRLLLASLLYYVEKEWMMYTLSFIFFVMGFGMLLIMLLDLRPNKGAFNNKIWWGPYRPFHIVFYLSIAYFLYKKNRCYPWKLFVLDALMSSVLFASYRQLN